MTNRDLFVKYRQAVANDVDQRGARRILRIIARRLAATEAPMATVAASYLREFANDPEDDRYDDDQTDIILAAFQFAEILLDGR